MKKILKSNNNTKKFISTLPKMYIVGRWAKYGVRDYPFTGKYIEVDGISVPLVYKYYDANGTCEQWNLTRISHVTTGAVILWTQNKSIAERIANALNMQEDLHQKELKNKF